MKTATEPTMETCVFIHPSTRQQCGFLRKDHGTGRYAIKGHEFVAPVPQETPAQQEQSKLAMWPALVHAVIKASIKLPMAKHNEDLNKELSDLCKRAMEIDPETEPSKTYGSARIYERGREPMINQLKDWPDREQWATASVIPPWLIIALHGHLFVVSVIYRSPVSLLFGSFVAAGIYLLVIIRKARRQLARETLRLARQGEGETK